MLSVQDVQRKCQRDHKQQRCTDMVSGLMDAPECEFCKNIHTFFRYSSTLLGVRQIFPVAFSRFLSLTT